MRQDTSVVITHGLGFPTPPSGAHTVFHLFNQFWPVAVSWLSSGGHFFFFFLEQPPHYLVGFPGGFLGSVQPWPPYRFCYSFVFGSPSRKKFSANAIISQRRDVEDDALPADLGICESHIEPVLCTGKWFGALMALLETPFAALMSNISRLFGFDRWITNERRAASSGCSVLDPRLGTGGQPSNNAPILQLLLLTLDPQAQGEWHAHYNPSWTSRIPQ